LKRALHLPYSFCPFPQFCWYLYYIIFFSCIYNYFIYRKRFFYDRRVPHYLLIRFKRDFETWQHSRIACLPPHTFFYTWAQDILQQLLRRSLIELFSINRVKIMCLYNSFLFWNWENGPMCLLWETIKWRATETYQCADYKWLCRDSESKQWERNGGCCSSGTKTACQMSEVLQQVGNWKFFLNQKRVAETSNPPTKQLHSEDLLFIYKDNCLFCELSDNHGRKRKSYELILVRTFNFQNKITEAYYVKIGRCIP